MELTCRAFEKVDFHIELRDGTDSLVREETQDLAELDGPEGGGQVEPQHHLDVDRGRFLQQLVLNSSAKSLERSGNCESDFCHFPEDKKEQNGRPPLRKCHIKLKA
jgi:hypothetical protein